MVSHKLVPVRYSPILIPCPNWETSGRPVSDIIGDVKFNVFQTIGRLNIGGKEGKDSEKEKEAEEEEMWMKEGLVKQDL